MEIQSELTDVGVAGSDPVRAGPSCPVASGVADVPEGEDWSLVWLVHID